MKLRALFRKDLYVLAKQMRLFLVFILVFSIMPNMNLNVFAILYSAMLPYTAMSYDAHSHWDDLAAMMPYSDRELVISKYLLGWALVCAAAAVSILAQLVTFPFLKTRPEPMMIGAGLFVGVLFMSLALPLMFRFGVEKGRMFLVVVLCAGGGAMGALAGLAFDGALPSPLLLPAAAAAVTAISIPLSVKMYRRRRR